MHEATHLFHDNHTRALLRPTEANTTQSHAWKMVMKPIQNVSKLPRRMSGSPTWAQYSNPEPSGSCTAALYAAVLLCRGKDSQYAWPPYGDPSASIHVAFWDASHGM